MKIFGIKIPMMASLILWAIVWEIIGQLELSILLPPFSHIIIRLFEIVPTTTFINAFWITAKCFLIGTLIAIVVGIPLGVLMGRSIVADRMLLPWVNMFLSAPLTALVPVLMTLFGFGTKTIILTTVLFAVWIIMLDARAGVKNITPSLVEMTKSFQANFWQAFTKVYVWAALPEILAGIRLGCIRSVKGVIIGQLLVSVVGFGRLFELYSSNFLMEHMWALLFVIFFFAFLIAEGLGILERKFEYYAASRN